MVTTNEELLRGEQNKILICYTCSRFRSLPQVELKVPAGQGCMDDSSLDRISRVFSRD